MKKIVVIILAILLVVIIGCGGYVIVGSLQNAPMPATAAALESDDAVTVTTAPFLAFSPAGQTPTIGLILYPGGLVPAQAYAPTARAIAEQGYLVVLPDMPLNLAVFAPNLADEIIPAYPMIDQWAIGGHSLGGAMAAVYAYNQPAAVEGLTLWAAYPTDSTPLTDSDLAVNSIYGTDDGVAEPATIEASRSLLPPDALFIPIEGGNHSQFGFYGDGLQSGDNPATISHAEQQAVIIAATADLLQSLAP